VLQEASHEHRFRPSVPQQVRCGGSGVLKAGLTNHYLSFPRLSTPDHYLLPTSATDWAFGEENSHPLQVTPTVAEEHAGISRGIM